MGARKLTAWLAAIALAAGCSSAGSSAPTTSNSGDTAGRDTSVVDPTLPGDAADGGAAEGLVDVDMLARDLATLDGSLPPEPGAAARELVAMVRASPDDAGALVPAAALLRRSGFVLVSVDGPVVAAPDEIAIGDVPIYAELLPNVVRSVRAGDLYPMESIGRILFDLDTVDGPMQWKQFAFAAGSWGKEDDAPPYIVTAASALRALSGTRGQVFASSLPAEQQGLDALQLLLLVGHAAGTPTPVAGSVVSGFKGGFGESLPLRAADPCDALKKKLSTEDLDQLKKLGVATGKFAWGKAVDHSLDYLTDLSSLPGSDAADLKLVKGIKGTLKAVDLVGKAASYASLVILLLGARLDVFVDPPAVTHYKHEDGSRAEEVSLIASAEFQSGLSQDRLACYGLSGLDVPKNGPLSGMFIEWSLGQDLRPGQGGQFTSSAHLQPTKESIDKLLKVDKTGVAGSLMDGMTELVLKPPVEDDPGTGEELKASVTVTAHLAKKDFPFELADLLAVLEISPAGFAIVKTIEILKSIAVDELLPTAVKTIGVRYHGAEPAFARVDNDVFLFFYSIPRVYVDLVSCAGLEGPWIGTGGYSMIGIDIGGTVTNSVGGAFGLPLLPQSSPAQDNPLSVLAAPPGQQTRFLVASGEGGVPFLEGLLEIDPGAGRSDRLFGWVTYDVGDGRQGSVVGTIELLLAGNPWPFSDLTGTVYRVASDPRCPPAGVHWDEN